MRQGYNNSYPTVRTTRSRRGSRAAAEGVKKQRSIGGVVRESREEWGRMKLQRSRAKAGQIKNSRCGTESRDQLQKQGSRCGTGNRERGSRREDARGRTEEKTRIRAEERPVFSREPTYVVEKSVIKHQLPIHEVSLSLSLSLHQLHTPHLQRFHC